MSGEALAICEPRLDDEVVSGPPADWDTATLGDVVDTLAAGVSVNADNREIGEGEIGVLKTSCVSGGRFVANEHKAVLTDEIDRVRTPVRAGSIIISRMNTPALVGANAYVDKDHPHLFLPDRLWQLRTNGRADCRWLSYSMQSASFRRFIDDIATGTSGSMKNISKKRLLIAPMALPPLDEQRRIAEVLRSVDEAIAFAERAATQARSTLDALLRDHFCSDGGDVSCGNLTPLSDLISLQSGFAFKSQEYQQNGHFLMRISNVQDGQVSLENPKFVTLDRKTQAFELQEGDILTSLTGNIGRVARLTTAHLPAALNQRVARIKPKSEVSVDADYLFFALKSPLFKASLFEESGGAAQQNVSPKAIGRVEIPLPPMEEQRRMGEMLLGIDDVIVQSEGSLEQLQNVKIDLMSDLLAGRVRVPA